MLTSYLDALEAARASYTAEKRADERRSDLPAYLLYRPVSFLLTPVFVLLGVSANGATLLGLVVALAMPAVALASHDRGALWVALLAVLFQVLDCVDGNLARLRKTESTVGQMLDSITSMLFWALYLISVGLATEGRGEGLVYRAAAEIGLTLGALLLAQRELEDTFQAYCGERVRWAPPSPRAAPRLDLERYGRLIEQVAAFGMLVLAWSFKHLDLFLATLTIYQASLLGVWVFRYTGRVWSHAREASNARPNPGR